MLTGNKDCAMARLQYIAPKDIPQHIVQRGNNRQVGFACDQGLAFYVSLLYEYSLQSADN